jgi:hypothetical protein
MSNKDFNMRAYIDIINESNKVEEGILGGLRVLAKEIGRDVAHVATKPFKRLGAKIGDSKLGKKAEEYKDAYNYGKYDAEDLARYDKLQKKYGFDEDEFMRMEDILGANMGTTADRANYIKNVLRDPVRGRWDGASKHYADLTPDELKFIAKVDLTDYDRGLNNFGMRRFNQAERQQLASIKKWKAENPEYAASKGFR